jgi:hypothetical protein
MHNFLNFFTLVLILLITLCGRKLFPELLVWFVTTYAIFVTDEDDCADCQEQCVVLLSADHYPRSTYGSESCCLFSVN